MRLLGVILGIVLALLNLGSPAAHAASGEALPVLTVDALAAGSPTPPVVSWTTGSGVPGSVYVVHSEGAERLFSSAHRGRQEAPWLRSPGRHEFRLYAKSSSHRKLIAKLEVENGRATTRMIARPDPPPRTPEAVKVTLRFVPVLVFGLILGLLGKYVRELKA